MDPRYYLLILLVSSAFGLVLEGWGRLKRVQNVDLSGRLGLMSDRDFLSGGLARPVAFAYFLGGYVFLFVSGYLAASSGFFTL